MDIKRFLMEYNASSSMTSRDMLVFDENSLYLGITKDKLMENAGASIARYIAANIKNVKEKHVIIFCGTGNNGGDGLVAARHVSSMAKRTTVVLIGLPRNIRTPEARANWDAIKQCSLSINSIIVKDSRFLPEIEEKMLNERDLVIVDALLGAGIRGKPREPIASTIKLINTIKNSLGAPVISVDVPSGISADDGNALGIHVEATSIITFHENKPGFIKDPGLGKITSVMPIGIPPEAAWIVGSGDAIALLHRNRRPAASIKGMNGKLLIIGGSEHYSGAPSLAAIAAQRCGVDLVDVCAPSTISKIVRAYSPDLIVTPLEGSYLSLDHVPIIEEKINWCDTLLIGPGLGRSEETFEAAIETCNLAIKNNKALIIDADGLKAIQKRVSIVNSENVILTPHSGEFSILSSVDKKEMSSLEKKLENASKFMKGKLFTMILKGPQDIIINGTRCKINRTGTPAMSVGGTGDVLAGISAGLTSLYNQKDEDIFDVACVAAHVNGLIGEKIENKIGGPFITASMMLDEIGKILSTFN
ncbi:MAG: NAD(P)H-hydrate dehydratase [Promethearchaeota archaeon]